MEGSRVAVWHLASLIIVSVIVIVPLTRFSVTLFGVPEEQELIAGIFIALTYGLLGSPILAALAR